MWHRPPGSQTNYKPPGNSNGQIIRTGVTFPERLSHTGDGCICKGDFSPGTYFPLFEKNVRRAFSRALYPFNRNALETTLGFYDERGIFSSFLTHQSAVNSSLWVCKLLLALAVFFAHVFFFTSGGCGNYIGHGQRSPSQASQGKALQFIQSLLVFVLIYAKSQVSA